MKRYTKVSGIIACTAIILLMAGCEKVVPFSAFDKKTVVKVFLDKTNRITSEQIIDSTGNITSTVNFLYPEGAILRIDDSNKISKYVLNSTGQIVCLLDSTAHGCDTLWRFEYDTLGYIKNQIRFEPPFTLNYTYDPVNSSLRNNLYFAAYFLNKENIVDFVINPASWYFLNLTHLGKQNQRLIYRIVYGANGGPSTYPAESYFDYDFDNSGLVIRKIERYYPAHHIGDPFTSENIERYLTTYQYITE